MRVSLLRVAAISLSVATFGLLAAPAVSADEIWYQSVGRASATATCQDSSSTDLATGWTVWRPIWEQWMNRGACGFTCSRALTWAKSSPASGGGGGGGVVACKQIRSTPSALYVTNFALDSLRALGSTQYSNSSCSTTSGTTASDLIYASSSGSAATICTAFNNSYSIVLVTGLSDVYSCSL